MGSVFDELDAPAKPMSVFDELDAPVAPSRRRTGVPESTRVLVETQAKDRVRKAPGYMSPVEGAAREMMDEASGYSPAAKVVQKITGQKPSFRPLPGDREEGGQLFDVSDMPLAGSAANVAEGVLLNERLFKTPQDVHTPVLDEVGNLASAVLQASAPGPTLAKAPTLVARLLKGAEVGAQMQLRRSGLTDPVGTATAAAGGVVGSTLAPKNLVGVVGAAIPDAILGAAETARVDPVLTAKMVDGTATPQERESWWTTMLFSVGPGVVGNALGMKINASDPGEAPRLTEQSRDRGLIEGLELDDAVAAEIGGQRARSELDTQRHGVEQMERAMRELFDLRKAQEEELNAESLSDADIAEMMHRADLEEMPLPPPRIRKRVPELLLEEQLNRPLPELRQPEPSDFDRPTGTIDPNFRDIGGAPYREPEFPLMDPFDRAVLEAQRQLPERIRQSASQKVAAAAREAGSEIQSELPLGKAKNVPTPEAAPKPIEPVAEKVAAATTKPVVEKIGMRQAPGSYEVVERMANGDVVVKDSFGDYVHVAAKDVRPVPVIEKSGPKGAGGPKRKNRGSIINIAPELWAMSGAALVAAPMVNKWARGRIGAAIDRMGARVKKGIAGIDSPIATVGRAFLPDFGAGTEVGRQKQMLEADREISRATLDMWQQEPVMRALAGADDLQQEVIHEALTHPSIPPQKWAILSPQQQQAVTFMKAVESGVTDEMLALKIGSKNFQKTLAANRGSFLRRAYAVNDDRGVVARNKKRKPQVWKAAIEEFALGNRERMDDDIVDSGGTPINIPIGEGELKVAENELASWIAKYDHEMSGPTTKYGAGFKVPQSPFKRRMLEHMPAVREILGEIKNPADAFSKTIADMHEIINRKKFFDRMATDVDENGVPFASPYPDVDTGRVAPVPHEIGAVMQPFGALSGKYVTPATLNSLTDSLGGYSALSTLEKTLNTLSKPMFINQTAGSTGTTGANVISNVTLGSELSNTSLGNPMNHQYYWRALDSLARGTPASWKLKNGQTVPVPSWKEMSQSGGFSGTMIDNPQLTEGFRSWKKMRAEGRSFPEFLAQVVAKYDRIPGVKQVVKFYRSIDHLFRAAAILKKTREGLEAGLPRDVALKQAAQHTDLFFQNYGKIPPALRGFQRSLMSSPFTSYPIDLVRVMANGARHNPVKLGMMMMAMGAIKAGYAAFTDEKNRRRMEEAKPLFEDFENADTNLWHVGDDKKIAVLPTARFVPVAQVGSMLQNPQASQFIMGNPFVAYAATIGGWNPPRGEKPTRLATRMERLGVANRNLGKSFMPPLLGGFEWDRLKKARSGQPDKYGRVQDPDFAWMGLTGVRPRSVEWDARYVQRAGELAQDTHERVAKALNVLQSPAPSESDAMRSLEELYERQAIVEDMIEKLNRALDAGEELAPGSISDKYAKNVASGRESLNRAKSELRNAINRGERYAEDLGFVVPVREEEVPAAVGGGSVFDELDAP